MITVEPVRIKCPVCTSALCDQLPNEQSVIEEQIDDIDDLRITDSDLIIVCGQYFISKKVSVWKNKTLKMKKSIF